MLKKVAIAFGIVVVVLVVVIATRPDAFRVERSGVIAAPPGVVFPMVNDFHKWAAWSPWEKLDPNLKRTYTGQAEGPGAKYAWVGNSQVGEGRMTIVDSKAPASISIKLEFLKPFESTSDTLFSFAEDGTGTRVTWTMSGKHNLISKAFSLFMDMDKMVGPDFEKGLATMKTLAEAEAKKTASEGK